ncbi:MAG TPA: hypothetical protein VE076_07950 [Nitrososphaeraceae archaeon]|nr:hypothetical protein [Nitrososphaeraceae archaeon]
MSTVERKSVNISMDLTTMLTGRIPKEKIEEKYICDHIPKNEQLNDDCNNGNQIF